jgi:hypothetical protein
MDWTCSYCGRAIGVYEEMVVLDASGYRLTSRAAEPELPFECGARFHRRCHAGARSSLFGSDELHVQADSRPVSVPREHAAA